jgi:hypothetical protein
MTLGIKKGGGFIHALRYDAISGRITVAERFGGVRDITADFKAVVDLGNLTIAWIRFERGKPPELVNEVPVGGHLGPRPGKDFQEGFRVQLKLDDSCGAEVCEFMSNANVTWNAMCDLHDLYLAGVEDHPCKLPVVTLTGTVSVPTRQGVALQPVFSISARAERPADLPDAPPPRSQPQPRTPEPPSRWETEPPPEYDGPREGDEIILF